MLEQRQPSLEEYLERLKARSIDPNEIVEIDGQRKRVIDLCHMDRHRKRQANYSASDVERGRRISRCALRFLWNIRSLKMKKAHQKKNGLALIPSFSFLTKIIFLYMQLLSISLEKLDASHRFDVKRITHWYLSKW
jgi:hypothetical protein